MVNRESFYFLSTIELLYQSYCSFYIVIDEYYERGELFVFFEFCDIEENKFTLDYAIILEGD